MQDDRHHTRDELRTFVKRYEYLAWYISAVVTLTFIVALADWMTT